MRKSISTFSAAAVIALAVSSIGAPAAAHAGKPSALSAAGSSKADKDESGRAQQSMSAPGACVSEIAKNEGGKAIAAGVAKEECGIGPTSK